MRWMSEDRIRRGGLPVGMPARWAPRRQRPVRTPAAPEREGSTTGRSRCRRPGAVQLAPGPGCAVGGHWYTARASRPLVPKYP
jgi:hypothetical protein